MPYHRLFRTSVLLTAAGLALIACRPRSEVVREHMQDHFDYATAIHAAIIDGDLEASREAARWVADHEGIDAPSSWDSYLESMRSTAQQVANAPSVGAAADGASRLTRACGSCHSTLAPEATFTASPAPADDPMIVPHMLRHNWAIERMWEGLTMSSVEAWNLGAQELSGTPVSMDAMSVEEGAAEAVSALAHRVHQLGAQGAAEVGWGGRTDVYGQLLTTCAACHQRVRQAGAPPEME